MTSGIVTTLFTGAPLGTPTALALTKAGNVIITDQNNVVAAFNVTSKVLTTIVSASNPCVSSGALPRAAVPDCAGNLWIPDFANNAVLMWNITTSSMTMVLSGPPLNGPKGIAVDPGGTIAFIANSNAGTISAYVIATGFISTFATGLTSAYGLALDGNGTLWAASADILLSFSNTGAVTTPCQQLIPLKRPCSFFSASSTMTPSVTPTVTPSVTPTVTPTVTPSLTATASITLSLSSSVTQTASQTATASATLTPSSSQSASQSQTQSVSGILTPSQTESASTTLTPSSTATASSTRTPSASATGTRSPTTSGSQDGSRSQTSTASVSASSSQTLSPSISASRSSSQTRSQMQSASGSASASGSTTPSQVSSQSSSPTVSQTASLSLSPSLSESASASQLRSLLPGESRSATPTPSSSPSSVPYAVEFLTPFSELGAIAVLSDSLPAVTLQLVLNRCPAVAAERVVSVQCDEVPSSDPLSLATRNVTIALSAPFSSMACPVLAAPPMPAVVPITASLFPAFRSTNRTSSVVCGLSSQSGAIMGSVSVNISVESTFWPTFDDVIVVASNGFSRSAGGRGVLNTTGALLRSAALIGAPGTLANAIMNSSIVLEAMMSAWGGVDVAGDSGVPFALTIFGATPLVLRAAQRSFSPATTVRVGGVLCDIAVTSEDGRWLAFVSPRTDNICSSAAVDCSYASLSVSNPPLGLLHGASLTCPPFCSGSLAPWSGIVPVPVPAVGADATSFVAARVQQPDTLPVVLSASDFGGVGDTGASAAAYAPGIYFATACSAGGIYTDPSTGACTNQSDPGFALCAFGGGAACEPCPSGAVCPGGFRCWSLPGYYVASESSSAVVPCGAPEPQSRCIGWSAALSQTKCGPSYLQGSYLCGACVRGYYLDSAGTCSVCPAVTSIWDKYGVLILLFVCVLGFAVTVFAVTSIAVRLIGGSLKGLMKSVLHLVVYFLTVIQVLSNVSQVNSKRLPRVLQSVYRGIALLQLQGVTLPPACLPDGYYFSAEVSLMIVGLFFWLAAVALSAVYWFRRGLLLWRFVRLSMLVALLLHPTISSTALGLVSCQVVPLTKRALAALDGGSTHFSSSSSTSSSPTTSDGSLAPVSLLSSNPFVVCFSSVHLPAGVLAAITLAVYVFCLPVLTLWWIWWDPWLRRNVQPARRNISRRRGSVVSHEEANSAGELVPDARTDVSGKSSSPWNSDDDTPAILWPFLRDSGYALHSWYWRHLDIGIVFGITALAALMPLPSTLSLLVTKLALTLALLTTLLACLVFFPNPYVEPWKKFLRVSLVVLSMSCVVVNTASRSLDLGYGGPSLQAFIAPASYVNIGVLCIAIAVALGGFGVNELRRLRAPRAASMPYTDAVTITASGTVKVGDSARSGVVSRGLATVVSAETEREERVQRAPWQPLGRSQRLGAARQPSVRTIPSQYGSRDEEASLRRARSAWDQPGSADPLAPVLAVVEPNRQTAAARRASEISAMYSAAAARKNTLASQAPSRRSLVNSSASAFPSNSSSVRRIADGALPGTSGDLRRSTVLSAAPSPAQPSPGRPLPGLGTSRKYRAAASPISGGGSSANDDEVAGLSPSQPQRSFRDLTALVSGVPPMQSSAPRLVPMPHGLIQPTTSPAPNVGQRTAAAGAVRLPSRRSFHADRSAAALSSVGIVSTHEAVATGLASTQEALATVASTPVAIHLPRRRASAVELTAAAGRPIRDELPRRRSWFVQEAMPHVTADEPPDTAQRSVTQVPRSSAASGNAQWAMPQHAPNSSREPPLPPQSMPGGVRLNAGLMRRPSVTFRHITVPRADPVRRPSGAMLAAAATALSSKPWD